MSLFSLLMEWEAFRFSPSICCLISLSRVACAGCFFHEVEQGGVGGENLQFFAIDGLHLGDFASEAEAGDDEAGPDDAVDTCGQNSCHDECEADEVGSRHQYRQEAQ